MVKLNILNQLLLLTAIYKQQKLRLRWLPYEKAPLFAEGLSCIQPENPVSYESIIASGGDNLVNSLLL